MTTKQRIKDLIPDLSDVERLENHSYYDNIAQNILMDDVYINFYEYIFSFNNINNNGIFQANFVRLIREFDRDLLDACAAASAGGIGASPFYIYLDTNQKDLNYLLQLLDILLSLTDFTHYKEYMNQIQIYLSDRYDIIYEGENRGVFLKNNVEIIEAVKKTSDQELIDIIKSANRVGVTDLKSQLNRLSTNLDVWAKECLNNDKDKKHPITKLISNFREALNDCPLSGRSESVQHGIANPQEKYTINLQSQRILFDMGLTLARLKLEFKNLKDIIKNEQ